MAFRWIWGDLGFELLPVDLFFCYLSDFFFGYSSKHLRSWSLTQFLGIESRLGGCRYIFGYSSKKIWLWFDLERLRQSLKEFGFFRNWASSKTNSMQNLKFLLQSKTRLGGCPIGRICSVRTNGNSLKMFLSTSYVLHRLVVSSWLVARRIPIVKERTLVGFKSTLTASRVGRITSKVLRLLPVKVGWFQKNFDWIHKQFRKTSRLTTRLYFKVIKCVRACR